MPLINCKVYLQLNWTEDCVLSRPGDSAKFTITDAKLHVPTVTLSTKDSANLTKQLSEGFKRSDDTAGMKNNKKYFLPRGEIKNCNVLNDGRNFYYQPINDIIKQYDEVRKISTRYGDDNATGCLMDYAYFKDNYKSIADDLNKQKYLDVDPRAIQQIVF